MRGGAKSIPTISAILREYITNKKGPVSCNELLEEVKKRRSDLKSRDLGATVRSVLQRGTEFVRTAPGMYRLSNQ
jgi:hypothetical protein